MTGDVTKAKLYEDLQTVVRDAEALLQATAHQTGERVEQVRERTEASLRQARARLALMEEQAMEQVREAAADADEYVRRNPWQAVGVAAGMALLVGLLISRR